MKDMAVIGKLPKVTIVMSPDNNFDYFEISGEFHTSHPVVATCKRYMGIRPVERSWPARPVLVMSAPFSGIQVSDPA